jgi:sulfite reductase beta subunit-like hemoprotein
MRFHRAVEWKAKPKAIKAAEQKDSTMIFVNLGCSGCIKGCASSVLGYSAV